MTIHYNIFEVVYPATLTDIQTKGLVQLKSLSPYYLHLPLQYRSLKCMTVAATSSSYHLFNCRSLILLNFDTTVLILF